MSTEHMKNGKKIRHGEFFFVIPKFRSRDQAKIVNLFFSHRRPLSCIAGVGLGSIILLSSLQAETMAWWRFDNDGFTQGACAQPKADAYQDSSPHGNALRRNDVAHPPEYSSDVPGPKVGPAGDRNTLGLKFPAKMESCELFTDAGKPINSVGLSEVTLEGAFKVQGSEYFRGILCKDGQPSPASPFPLFQVAMVRADPDPVNIGEHLVVQWTDGSGTPRMLKTIAPLAVGRWYAFAVVMTKTTATLLIKHDLTKDYQIESTVPVDKGGMMDANGRWAVGRGFFNGVPDCPFYGELDEIRISNEALPKEKLLFPKS